MDLSQNQTERFGLHLWAPEDDFLREEFNENFAKLDAVVWAVAGTYVGDGAAVRHIELGGRPMAVHLELDNGLRHNLNNTIWGGLAVQDTSLASGCAAIDDTGFILNGASSGARLNDRGQRYVYLAVLAGGA